MDGAAIQKPVDLFIAERFVCSVSICWAYWALTRAADRAQTCRMTNRQKAQAIVDKIRQHYDVKIETSDTWLVDLVEAKLVEFEDEVLSRRDANLVETEKPHKLR